MQDEFNESHPELQVKLLTVNEWGQDGGNVRTIDGVKDLPLLQDVDENGDFESDAWASWDVNWRDVIIVDANSEVVATYSLTPNDLRAPEKYDELKQLILDAAEPAVVSGDCNGDISIDASDLTCARDVFERDLVLDALNTLPGDLDGDGEVAFADFLLLSTNFGKDLPSYADGNIDLQNGVDFSDFLVLSSNFGQSLSATPTDADIGEWDTEDAD